MESYSHRERIEMILAGETPDRFAASFWRHFFHMEHTCEGTAEAMLAFQKEFDWDFMKINPRADFHVEDWGLKQEWSRDEFKKHTKSNFPITTIDDLANLKPLSATEGVLGEHLKMVNMIKKKSDPELPILMTVFTPLAIAGRMLENQKMLVEFLRTEPEKVEQGLQVVTDTFARFAAELRNAGADGLFFATTQWASEDMISWEEYERFGLPYDLKVIQAAEPDALNLFHVCSSANYLKKLKSIDYNAALYNWDSCDPSNSPLDKGVELLDGKAIVGGVDQHGWLLKSEPDEVAYLIDQLKEKNSRSRLIIGPGCSVPPEVPMANFQAIRDNLR